MAPGRVSVIQRSKTTGGSWRISLMKWSSSSNHPPGLSESEVVNGTKPSSSYSRHLMMNRVMCMREDDNCPAFSPAWCMINTCEVCHDILNLYYLQKSVRKIDGSSIVLDVFIDAMVANQFWWVDLPMVGDYHQHHDYGLVVHHCHPPDPTLFKYSTQQ